MYKDCMTGNCKHGYKLLMVDDDIIENFTALMSTIMEFNVMNVPQT